MDLSRCEVQRIVRIRTIPLVRAGGFKRRRHCLRGTGIKIPLVRAGGFKRTRFTGILCISGIPLVRAGGFKQVLEYAKQTDEKIPLVRAGGFKLDGKDPETYADGSRS